MHFGILICILEVWVCGPKVFSYLENDAKAQTISKACRNYDCWIVGFMAMACYGYIILFLYLDKVPWTHIFGGPSCIAFLWPLLEFDIFCMAKMHQCMHALGQVFPLYDGIPFEKPVLDLSPRVSKKLKPFSFGKGFGRHLKAQDCHLELLWETTKSSIMMNPWNCNHSRRQHDLWQSSMFLNVRNRSNSGADPQSLTGLVDIYCYI